MTKQLDTALEARRWMVANPWKEIKEYEGDRWRWNPAQCQYEWDDGDMWRPNFLLDEYPPFTIIDEPTVRDYRTTQTDPVTGQQLKPEWFGKPLSPLTAAITKRASEATAEAANRFEAAKKQPEWVRVFIAEENPIQPKVGEPFPGEMEYVWASKPDICLQRICQNAQQVRINYPDWSVAAQGSHYYNMGDLDFNEEMEILYALQIGATVEYLPEEGE